MIAYVTVFSFYAIKLATFKLDISRLANELAINNNYRAVCIIYQKKKRGGSPVFLLMLPARQKAGIKF